MKKTSISLIIAGMMALPAVSAANDFLTVTTVQYVQECIELNSGKMNIYESTHKCSCVIDKLSEEFTQTEFEEADTGFQLKNLPGDRGGEFRDDKNVGSGVARFQEVHVKAYASCRMR
ncbi:MAG: hypothetical protein COA63_005760 [Methylophaga sp.]|nr:hypothetical protein [Methylophaga sp.]